MPSGHTNGYDSSDAVTFWWSSRPEGQTLTLPPGPQPIGGPGGQDGQAAARVLDAEYASDAAILDDESRHIISLWQRDDRTYQEFQRVAREESDDALMVERADILDVLIERHRLAQRVLVYRGVRNAPKVFGLDTSALSDLIGQTVPLSGYFATSVHRAVAASEFTRPPSGDGPALLEVEVPAGTPALWIPPLGDGALAPRRATALVVCCSSDCRRRRSGDASHNSRRHSDALIRVAVRSIWINENMGLI